MNTPKITDRNALFIEAYLSNGGYGTKAAIEAGYGPRSAHVTASRLLKKPQVLAAITDRAVMKAKVYSPLAMDILYSIMSNCEVAPRDRVSAAKAILDRAGVANQNSKIQVNVNTGSSASHLIAELEKQRVQQQKEKNKILDATATTISISDAC